MSVLVNLSVYVLLFGPLTLLLRGHRIELMRHAWLAVLLVAVQLLELLLLESLQTIVVLGTVARVVLLPAIEACVFDFVLLDGKAQRVLALHTQPSDAAAATATTTTTTMTTTTTAAVVVTVLWCLSETLLTRWFVWYRTMASPGFEAMNVYHALDAFALLLATLATCRYLCSRQASLSPSTSITTTTAASAAASPVSPLRVVIVVRVVAGIVGVATMHLLLLQSPFAFLSSSSMMTTQYSSSSSGHHGSMSSGLLANSLTAVVFTVATRYIGARHVDVATKRA